MLGLIDRIDARIAGLLQDFSKKPRWAVCLIACLAMLIALPGLQSMPVTDRDEARYAQASKQMMETGDYIDIRNLDEPRWKKPVGIYWLQVASAKTFGQGEESGIWSYRLPSALGIILAACLTWWALLPLISRNAALIAGLVVASTAATATEAHLAKTDAALLAATTLVFGALIRIYLNRGDSFSRAHFLLWAGLGLGFLLKGPIILIPLGGALLWLTVAERSTEMLRKLFVLRGFLLFALIAAPWYIAIAIKTDGAFFAESLGRDLLGKVNQTAEKHGGPPGYYLGTVWLTFWPWASLILFALPLAWSQRRSEHIRILTGWIIPCWLLFALLSTKLPHYILPILPAFAALIGLGFERATSSRTLRTIAILLFLAGALGASVFAILPRPYLEQEYPASLLIAAGLIALLLLLATISLATNKRFAFAGFGCLSLLIMFPTLTIITAPNTERLFLSPELLAAHDTFEPCADRPIISNGYTEMSLAFLGGTDTQFVSKTEAAEALSRRDGSRVFVRLDGTGETIPKLSETSGQLLETLAVIEGTNYNSGKDVTIALLAAAGDPALADCKLN